MKDATFAEIGQVATNLYLSHVRRTLGQVVPAVDDGAGLRALAERLADVKLIEETNGWKTDPPFPGAAADPAKYGAVWMMFCATNIVIDGEPRAQIVTSLATGRMATVVANAPGPTPAGWKPLF